MKRQTKLLRRLFPLTFILLAGLSSNAQHTYKGIVFDKENQEPLLYATMGYYGPDSTIKASCTSDAEGRFQISIPDDCPDGRLVIRYLGYLPYTASLPIPDTIFMAWDPDAMLDAVVVEAKAPVVEQQVDKLVMNVAQSAFAQSSDALELLRKAPGVSIDKDGNILLNGQAVSVWIDGRPSYLDGKSLESLLKSTPGSSIDKIEIMANPSAKYDAEGQGGILNIKTKRNFMQGLNGSVNASLGGMPVRTELDGEPASLVFCRAQNLGVNLSYRTQKSNTFFQISEASDLMGVELNNSTSSTLGGIESLQKASSITRARTSGLMMKLGNDWFLDSANTLGVIFSAPINRMNQWSVSDENRMMFLSGGNPALLALANASTGYSVAQLMGNLNYTHVFNPLLSRELTVNLDYMRNTTHADNLVEDSSFVPAASDSWLFSGYSRDQFFTTNTIDVYSAKADWQGVVLGRFMMEAGGKWATSVTHNDLMHEALASSDSSDFTYNENVGAIYATLAGQLSQHITAKIGLRGEQTLASNNTNSVRQNYFDLFPTLFAGYNSSDMMKRYSFSYTRRIQRPNYSQLNPFKNYVDAHTANMGNPDLKPCYSDIFNLSAGFGYHLTLNATYMNIKDVITITPMLDLVSGDQIMMQDNFGQNRLLGGSLTLSELPLSKPLTFTLSLQAYDFHSYAPSTTSLIIGQTGSEEPYDVHSFYGSAYGCLTYTAPKNWKVQLDGWGSTPVTSGYFRTSWNYSVNLGVKKSTADNRLTFSFNINDIFRTINGSFSIMADENVTASYTQRYLMQKATIGLQWNFGQAQKPLKQRNVGTIDEASRTGANNTLNAGGTGM